MSSNDDSTAAIEHPNWMDVSEETGFRFHWHHRDSDDENYLSIRMADESSGIGLGGYACGWTVELYPDPNANDEMTRWRFPPSEYDDPEACARDQVRSIMEEYDDQLR